MLVAQIPVPEALPDTFRAVDLCGVLLNGILGGLIARRTKWVASASMLLALSILLLTVNHMPSVLFAAAGMSCGALFIWTRPEKPRAG